MNREIKFRAWDGKKMLLNVGVHPHLCSDLSHDDEYYKDNQDGRWIIGLGFDSYKVMQYTGLKDKNGKEIYEGDILTFTRGVGNWTGKTLTTIHDVYYSDVICAFVLNGKGEYIKLRRLENRYIYEIIGNIYENPELLK